MFEYATLFVTIPYLCLYYQCKTKEDSNVISKIKKKLLVEISKINFLNQGESYEILQFVIFQYLI